MKYKFIFSMIKLDEADVVHQVIEKSQVVFTIPDDMPETARNEIVSIAIGNVEKSVRYKICK